MLLLRTNLNLIAYLVTAVSLLMMDGQSAQAYSTKTIYKLECLNPYAMVVPDSCCSNSVFKGEGHPECQAGSGSANQGMLLSLAASTTVATNSLQTAKAIVTNEVDAQKSFTSSPSATLDRVTQSAEYDALPTDPEGGSQNFGNAQSSRSRGGASSGQGSSAGGALGMMGGNKGSSSSSDPQAQVDALSKDSGRMVGYVRGEQGAQAKASGAGSATLSGFGNSDAGDHGLSDDAAMRSLASDEEEGVSEDPKDYFSRISPAESIFKVVSRRYVKKQSLWVKK